MNEPSEKTIPQTASNVPEGDRTAFLKKTHGTDSAFLHRPKTSLSSETPSSNFGPSGTMMLDTNNEATISDGPSEDVQLATEETMGESIGRYKLLEKIGEGGFGRVYMAEQSEPVKRRVALKIIKLGMDTHQVVARFEAERQALAMMDHSNIARVLDAGATEIGRPYFVMEFVRGTKITEYCDKVKMPTRQRLNLFIKICRAIEHAHQKGIIHRDIKPSNILVAEEAQGPVPKVIDFGIAKATQGSLTEKTLFTQMDQFIGTPAYMSPEQADPGMDVDTRSDIYSLGVLLYELLTGETPLESKNLLSRGMEEMRRLIREWEPQRPSIRLHKQAKEQTTTAASHGTDTPRLIRLVQGDLDWVVMKCLEKDRARRYNTAGELSAEIQRFLDNEPVQARPPSAAYRFQKLVARNRGLFATGAAIVLFLIIGLCVTSWFWLKESHERDIAQTATHNAESDLKIAQAERAKAMRALQAEEQAHRQAAADEKQRVAAQKQAQADQVLAQTAQQQAAAARDDALAARQEAKEALQQAQHASDKAALADAESKNFQAQAAAARDQMKTAQLLAQAETKNARLAQTALKAAQTERDAAFAVAQASTKRADDIWQSAIPGRLAELPANVGLAASLALFPEKAPSAKILEQRAEWYARSGQFDAAITNFEHAAVLDPGNFRTYDALAALYAQVDGGQTNAYGIVCSNILAKFDPAKNAQAAFDCALMPVVPVFTRITNNISSQTNLAAALVNYRNGKFDAAAKILSQLPPGESTNAVAVQTLSLGALVQWQLKEVAQAGISLSNANQLAKTCAPVGGGNDLGRDWSQWMNAELLRREALKTVVPPAAVK